jgi:hypothetical protein
MGRVGLDLQSQEFFLGRDGLEALEQVRNETCAEF